MADPIYVVTLKDRDDLDGFYADMKSGGYTCVNKRPISRATHYDLTESQADTIASDSRVLAVELHPDEDDRVVIGFDGYINNEVAVAAGDFYKGVTTDSGDRKWGHLHCAGDDAQRTKNSWGSGSVTDTAEWFNNGKHVDVVICDDNAAYDCQDWYSTVDPAKNRYVQYDWYANHNAQVIGGIDDDGYSSPGNNYQEYFINNGHTNYHGTHVTGTVAGKHYGWATEANIYNIQCLGGHGVPMNTLLLFDYLRAFHRYKAINPETGQRNPTITNHSWGYGSNLSSIFDSGIDINDVGSVVYRGTTYSSNNPNPSGWTDEGLAADFGISWRNRLGRQWDYVDADVQDLIDDGVVHIGAAGNEHVMQVPKTDPDTGVQHIDWDNRMYVNAYGTVYMCRAGSPNGAHQTAQGLGGDGRSVINVGSLESDSDFRKSTFSNYGPQISTFAPGSDILSGVTSNVSGGQIDPKYGGENWWGVLSGTSMASPQVCGIAACLASGADRFTNSDLLGFIQNYGKLGDMSFAVAPQGNNSYSANFSLPTGTDHFIVTANHRGSTTITNANDPTIEISVGDTIIFNHPGSDAFFYPGSATSASHFEITYIDRTNMFSGATTTSNDPTLNFEVGEVIQIANYQNTTNGTLYIKTTNSTGSGDLVTSGEFQEAFGGFAGAPHDPSNNGWAAGEQGYWYTVNVTPGLSLIHI